MRRRAVGRVAVAEHALAPQLAEGPPQQPVAAVQRQRAAPGVGLQARADLDLGLVAQHLHQAEPAAEAPFGRLHQRQQRIADLAVGVRLAGFGQGLGVGRQGALGAPDAAAFMPAVEILQAGDEALGGGGLVQRQVVHQLGAHARVAVHAHQVVHVVRGKLAQPQPGAGLPGRWGEWRCGRGHAGGTVDGRGPARHPGRYRWGVCSVFRSCSRLPIKR